MTLSVAKLGEAEFVVVHERLKKEGAYIVRCVERVERGKRIYILHYMVRS